MIKTRKVKRYLLSLAKKNLGIEKKKPKILSYLITDYCNSHCITCSVWHNNEINHIDEERLKAAMRSELFSEVEHVGVSGGEPSTFSDLLSHINIILDNLPRIQTLSITSNCINYQFWLSHLTDIYQICKGKHVYFQLNVSLDGIGSMHDKIRGSKNNFAAVEKVIQCAQLNSIPYQIHSTINRLNVYHVGAILHYARNKRADIIFRLASEIFRLNNTNQIERITLNDKEKSFICDFFNSKDLLSYTKSPGRRLFYYNIVKQLLQHSGRKAPCYFKEQGLVLSADGKCSFCSRFTTDFGEISDEKLLTKYQNHLLFEQCCNHTCDDCYHDQNGLWPLKDVISEYLSPYILNLKKLYKVMSNHLDCFFLKYRETNRLPVEHIVVIGMYGGEHVGDAAILGGVLLRTFKRYPTIKRVFVYSFRPDRTECWIDCLTELKQKVLIKSVWGKDMFVDAIRQSQLLLWAGGPVMELPIVLSRNYYFVRKALSLGVKFEMEGIGYGPINTIYGKYITRKIMSRAQYLTARSETDFQNVRSHLKYKDYLYDPAYDYLHILPRKLDLSPDRIRNIDKLFEGNQAGVIALNIRPLWNRYGKNGLFSIDTFMNELVSLVLKMESRGIKTIFFPMNADKYGFSDLDAAYVIRDKLPKDSIFTIWETEPSINEVVYFLRKVDRALCMRYHAVIYALSQNVKTIGIDYSLSGKGKVSTLFDNGKDCVPINLFNSEMVFKLIIANNKKNER